MESSRHLNYNKHLLISGLLFTLHNVEEAIGFARFSYPENLNLPLEPPTAERMISAIVLITLIAWGILFLAYRQKNETLKRNILTTMVSIFLINAFFPHIAGTIFIHRYFPAVVTAIVLYLPYAIWMMPKLFRSYSTSRKFRMVVVTGLMVSTGLVLILQFIVKLLF